MEIIEFIKLVKKRQVGYFNGDYTNYLNFQRFQANEILRELQKRDISLAEKRVLELGVGTGGYSPVFKKNSKELIINDIKKPHILSIDPSLKFKKFDVSKTFPFNNNSFDFVFCCSLIEHINNPRKMLSEIHRILKPGGHLYLSFPPFYSPVGGHYFKPFHLLGEKLSIKIVNFLKINKVNSNSYKRGFGAFGLYKRTIKGTKELLKQNAFEIKDIWARYPSPNTTRIPFLREFLTWHVCFLCKK